jgi:hypothetical protein
MCCVAFEDFHTKAKAKICCFDFALGFFKSFSMPLANPLPHNMSDNKEFVILRKHCAIYGILYVF